MDNSAAIAHLKPLKKGLAAHSFQIYLSVPDYHSGLLSVTSIPGPRQVASGGRMVVSSTRTLASGQWPVKCEAEEIAVIKMQNKANLLLVLISGTL